MTSKTNISRRISCTVVFFLMFLKLMYGGLNVWTSNGPYGGHIITLVVHPSNPSRTGVKHGYLYHRQCRMYAAGRSRSIPSILTTFTPVTSMALAYTNQPMMASIGNI
jgi:hypothetical protein